MRLSWLLSFVFLSQCVVPPSVRVSPLLRLHSRRDHAGEVHSCSTPLPGAQAVEVGRGHVLRKVSHERVSNVIIAMKSSLEAWRVTCLDTCL